MTAAKIADILDFADAVTSKCPKPIARGLEAGAVTVPATSVSYGTKLIQAIAAKGAQFFAGDIAARFTNRSLIFLAIFAFLLGMRIH